jgi:hypothetical protein
MSAAAVMVKTGSVQKSSPFLLLPLRYLLPLLLPPSLKLLQTSQSRLLPSKKR